MPHTLFCQSFLLYNPLPTVAFDDAHYIHTLRPLPPHLQPYGLPLAAQTKITAPKNKYSPQQDVQIGREAAAEVRKEYPLLRDGSVDRFVEEMRRLGLPVGSVQTFPEGTRTARDAAAAIEQGLMQKKIAATCAARRENVARRKDAITGSSDYHGSGKEGHDLGCNTTEPEQLERLLELAARAAEKPCASTDATIA